MGLAEFPNSHTANNALTAGYPPVIVDFRKKL
jgi:hypothetical protein